MTYLTEQKSTAVGLPAARPDVLVRAVGVRKVYTLGGQEIRALDGVSLEIKSGEFVAIMGPSGSGKSTLMNLVGALDVPTAGTMEILGHDLLGLDPNALADLRNRSIGFVFQQFNLLARTPALRQVTLPMQYRREAVSDIDARARACLAAVQLADRMDHLPSQLSGGQQQRVAIARALVNEPRIILADEPTGALDSRTSREIMQLFRDLNARGMTIVVVTHDAETAAYADRVILFRDGRIVSDTSRSDALGEVAA